MFKEIKGPDYFKANHGKSVDKLVMISIIWTISLHIEFYESVLIFDQNMTMKL